MKFIDAKILVKTAADNGILIYACPKKQHVFVYRGAGDENHPEGWYIDSIDDVAQALMDDEEGQKLFITELQKLGVEIKWFDWEQWNKDCRFMESINVKIEDSGKVVIEDKERGKHLS